LPALTGNAGGTTLQLESLRDHLVAALDGRRLLDSPFYDRWTRGDVTTEELRAYAGQYRHFEAALPGFLESIAVRAPDQPSRDQVLRNLADERGDATGVSHLELFDRYATALGAPEHTEPTPAMRRLLATYQAAVADGPATGMAAILAYEAQAPDVSETKAAGLREHYGMSDAAVKFWDVHGEVDREHAEWALATVAGMSDDEPAVSAAMRNAACAWWAFLDERELAAAEMSTV
jgi:pyrroloquinoline-quinone synthase